MTGETGKMEKRNEEKERFRYMDVEKNEGGRMRKRETKRRSE